MIPQIHGDTFVISDCHFGHKNVTKFEPMRAKAVAASSFDNQEDLMVAKWNAAIGPDDEVLVLGDFAFSGINKYAKRLNGRKYLIRGNHDKSGDHAYREAGFEYVFNTIVMQDTMSDRAWELANDDPYISGVAVHVDGYGGIFFSHYPVNYYEDYYTRQRAVDLTMRISQMSNIADDLGCMINVHGHTHSVIVENTERYTYVNTSTEVLDFTPTRLKDLLRGVK